MHMLTITGQGQKYRSKVLIFAAPYLTIFGFPMNLLYIYLLWNRGGGTLSSNPHDQNFCENFKVQNTLLRGQSCLKLPTGLHLLSNFYSNPFTEGQRDFIFTSTLFETPILVNLSCTLCNFFTFGKFYSICFFSLFSLDVLLRSYYYIMFIFSLMLNFL